MAKFNFSKTFNIQPSVMKEIVMRGNPNSPYSKTLKLKVGEAFVIYNATLADVHLPYTKAKKLGIKFATKSNFRLGDRKGLLVTRIS
jgi:hypothetical protein